MTPKINLNFFKLFVQWDASIQKRKNETELIITDLCADKVLSAAVMQLELQHQKANFERMCSPFLHSQRHYCQLREFLTLYIDGLERLRSECDNMEKTMDQFRVLMTMVVSTRQNYHHLRYRHPRRRAVTQHRWLSRWRRRETSKRMIASFCDYQVYFIETAIVCIGRGGFVQKQLLQTLQELQLILQTSLPQVDDYACPICLGLFYKPVTLQPCNHSLCQDCFETLGKHNSKSCCPVCRATIAAVHPDQALTNLIKLYFPGEQQRLARDRRGMFYWLSDVATLGGLMNPLICVALSNPIWQIYQEHLDQGQNAESYYDDLTQAQGLVFLY
ncbi:hypothetical protein DFQ29_003012 [Apophysomyces sp. BC1021]|nr:hypothetical protein DFQ29_003012 [Apophysomyces sp. BC1021]